MQPETIAAVISALAAILTVYMYRSQGKGFIWTKEQKVELGMFPDNGITVMVSIPLFNLGHGNIRFLSLTAKIVHLRNKSIDTFKMTMDEAYFPPNVPIIVFKSNAFSNIKHADPDNPPKMLLMSAVLDDEIAKKIDSTELQKMVNRGIEEMGEVLFILKCKYKDGSWMGYGVRTTTIAMSLKNNELNYLSVERRKELDELFQF